MWKILNYMIPIVPIKNNSIYNNFFSFTLLLTVLSLIALLLPLQWTHSILDYSRTIFCDVYMYKCEDFGCLNLKSWFCTQEALFSLVLWVYIRKSICVDEYFICHEQDIWLEFQQHERVLQVNFYFPMNFPFYNW